MKELTLYLLRELSALPVPENYIIDLSFNALGSDLDQGKLAPKDFAMQEISKALGEISQKSIVTIHLKEGRVNLTVTDHHG